MEIVTAKIDGLELSGFRGDYIFEKICQNGIYYENDILEKWLPALQDFGTILDIGANLGNHSLFWAKRRPNALIYSFEPFNDSFMCLRENVEVNGLSGRIIPVNMAVGKSEGYAQVSEFDPSNLGGTTFIMSSEPTEHQVISADSFVSQTNIENIAFVKIDTEGFEVLILSGMVEVLKKNKPIIWIEVSYESYRDVKAFMSKHNYRLLDYSGFNMLYTSYSDHNIIFDDSTEDRVFDEMLKYLDRTNFYYKAYITAKKWSEDKGVDLEKSHEQYKDVVAKLDKANEKYRESMETYNRLKGWYDDALAKLSDAQKQYTFTKTLNAEYAEELTVNITDSHHYILILQNLRNTLSRQQSQVNALKQENQEYRRKLSLITDSWYGKILVKCYRLIKKVCAHNPFQKKAGGA
jgi:FkbM family methyltransferase